VPEVISAPAHAGQHTRAVLADWGVAPDRIDALFESKAVAGA
jgi:crotonobetainyl-CoA:carnitine CoA-transferase CaiB-like acyl-CoA transferase